MDTSSHPHRDALKRTAAIIAGLRREAPEAVAIADRATVAFV